MNDKPRFTEPAQVLQAIDAVQERIKNRLDHANKISDYCDYLRSLDDPGLAEEIAFKRALAAKHARAAQRLQEIHLVKLGQVLTLLQTPTLFQGPGPFAPRPSRHLRKIKVDNPAFHHQSAPMEKLKRWCHAHPFKLAAFVGLDTFLATMAGVRPDLLPILLAAFLCLLVVIFYTLHSELRVILALGLALSLRPVQAQEQPIQPATAPVVIGVAVIVVGGVAIYLVARFCQKHFPPPPARDTNAPPAAVPVDDYAASHSYAVNGSCFEPSSDWPAVVLQIDWQLQDQQLLVSTRLAASQETADWSTYQSRLAAYGIGLPDNGQVGQSFFGWAGQPATQAQVPIYFAASGTITLGSCPEPACVVIDRSVDLEHWERVLESQNCQANLRGRLIDTQIADQTFYRVSLQ